MPTSATTGTTHMNTAGGDGRTKAARAAKAKAAAETTAAPEATADGAHPRRNRTLDDGTTVAEELRPGSKKWVEVERRPAN